MKGSDRFLEILEKYQTRPVLLYGDPDVDGLMSLLLMCQFCDMLGIKYSYFVNDDRYHGFTIEHSRLKGYLVIAADFTITEAEAQALVDNDVCLLSTDHHECQSRLIDVKSETAEGVVINNQYPFEPEDNRYQSGAGVFYELACELFPEFESAERDALVGVTLLSDMRPIENDLARRYLKKTYTSDPQVGYIHYLISCCLNNDFGFGVPKFDRNFVDYTLSPTINALLRANKTSSAVDFILGRGLKHRGTKDFQKMLLQEMHAEADVMELSNYTILRIDSYKFAKFGVKISGYIGLLCNDYKDKHKNISTLGIVVDNGHVVRSSFRGKYDDIHYLSGFRNLGIHADGHPTAFGIKDFWPNAELWQEIDDLIGDLEVHHQTTVRIVNAANLAVIMTKSGMNMAMENGYVRDMYRSYIKYTGKNIKVAHQTYQTEELTVEEAHSGVKPDVVKGGVGYKYVRDKNGQLIPKYIEYMVDGRRVKSFGVAVEDGLILPILEKGYINLYVRPQIE